MKRYLLLVLTLMILLGCATAYKPRSSEPTPAVTCDESAPFERLADYPAAPAVEPIASLDARHASGADYRAALVATRAYSRQQALWAIATAGVIERNQIKRDSTAACLDAYRKRGVIL